KNFAILLSDPDNQPTHLRSVAATCDRTAIGHAAAAPPIAPRNVRLPIWTIIGTSLDAVAHNNTIMARMRPSVRFRSHTRNNSSGRSESALPRAAGTGVAANSAPRSRVSGFVLWPRSDMEISQLSKG